jgi:hypothetical protein
MPARPWPQFVGLLLLVVLAHALLLTGLPVGLHGDDSRTARALSVRQVSLPPPPLAEAPAQAATAVARPVPPRPAQRRSPAPVRVSTDASADRAPEAPVAAAVSVAGDAEPAPADAAGAASAPAASVVAAHAPAAAQLEALPVDARSSMPVGDAPPTYATRVPPPATLRYELRRGLVTGQGELSWRPTSDGYELQIEGVAFGLSLLGWGSQGRFDAAGLAPQRFVDRRRGRDLRAANFQRDKGVISWSGVTHEAPLAAGAQDRLSWMLQLAAIAEADPARLIAGERVLMQVAGARGDVDVWTFVVGGREDVDVAGSRIEGALVLRRAPRKPFDTGVEVWLDPARHHLPARLKLSTAGGGDSLEFLLRP